MCSGRAYRVPGQVEPDEDDVDIDPDFEFVYSDDVDGEDLLEEFFAQRNRQLEFDKCMNRVERLKDSTDSEAVSRELQHVLAVLERCKFYEEGQ